MDFSSYLMQSAKQRKNQAKEEKAFKYAQIVDFYLNELADFPDPCNADLEAIFWETVSFAKKLFYGCTSAKVRGILISRGVYKPYRPKSISRPVFKVGALIDDFFGSSTDPADEVTRRMFRMIRPLGTRLQLFLEYLAVAGYNTALDDLHRYIQENNPILRY